MEPSSNSNVYMILHIVLLLLTFLAQISVVVIRSPHVLDELMPMYSFALCARCIVGKLNQISMLLILNKVYQNEEKIRSALIESFYEEAGDSTCDEI